MLLATALTAGSAVARLHGHERRHAHLNSEVVAEVEAPATTPAPAADVDIEKRGEMVSAVINGVLQTWINNWTGEPSSTSTSTTFAVAATSIPESAPNPSAVESQASATPVANSGTGSDTSSGSGGAWSSIPSNGQFSRVGFSGTTLAEMVSSANWGYKGNLGNPWGSNIIQVSEADANQYKHVLRLENAGSEPLTFKIWNTYGPDGGMTGFSASTQAALTLIIEPNKDLYVAIDENSQGAFTAFSGNQTPTDEHGIYAATWGEFDMSSARNKQWSGWDVSCIIAQDADMEIQGMKICNSEGKLCSSISKGMRDVVDAYTAADRNNDSKAMSQGPGAVRLVVTLNYD